MSYFGTKDYLTEVRKGNVSGASILAAIGHSDTVGTTLRPIYHEHNTAGISTEALLATPDTVWVASTSANDATTGPGTGAQTITLTGLDGSGNAQTEAIPIEGTTAQESSSTWSFVQIAQVTAVGSGGSNAGVIWVGDGTFTAGVPATKYDAIEIGTNLSRKGEVVIPTGKKGYVQQLLFILSDTAKTMNVQLKLRRGGINYELFDIHSTQSEFVTEAPGAPALLAGDLLSLYVDVSATTAICTATAVVLIEDA
jgi:hypothetical protein